LPSAFQSFIRRFCSLAAIPARILDLAYPVHSPSQPLDNTIGAIAIYLLAFVAVTSYIRIRLGRHLWKAFHFSVYFAAAALFWHSLFTDLP